MDGPYKINITPVVCEDEPDAHNVGFTVGVQSFCVTPLACETNEDAKWHASMLNRALSAIYAAGRADADRHTGGVLDSMASFLDDALPGGDWKNVDDLRIYCTSVVKLWRAALADTAPLPESRPVYEPLRPEEQAQVRAIIAEDAARGGKT